MKTVGVPEGHPSSKVMNEEEKALYIVSFIILSFL
jgi:hypothetical protein